MKSVLISIKPKWCELIAGGKKTIEVRKTKPKIDTPFKCYIYETTTGKIMTGTVAEVYPTFVLIDLGKYKVCAYIRDLNNCASIAI